MSADEIKPILSAEQVDALLDGVLRASGSALRMYSLELTLAKMRAAIRAIERAAIQADRASRADHFRDATNLINESAAVLDVLTIVLPPGHRLRQDAECGAKRLVAGLYELAASFSTDAAPSPQGDAWMRIEEDAPVDVPLDTPVLLAWWNEWSSEWKIEVNYAGSERGGWRHGRATHWQPLIAPPIDAARSTPAKGGE